MKSIRADFPILSRCVVAGFPLVYLDNASTTHKPHQVIDALVRFYAQHNANTYRGVHSLGEQATTLYESARATVARFIGAKNTEIAFTSGTTQGINIIAQSWAMQHVGAGDEILLTELEHHANLVPWQYVAQKTGAKLVFIPINDEGALRYETLEMLINERTKLVAVTHCSNAIGTHVDVVKIAHLAHRVGARVLVDAAQTVPRGMVDVGVLDADFLVFSGHKMFGPTGVGALFVRESIQQELVPYQFGGGMVFEVLKESSTFLPFPHLLEAGTPAIAQAIGLAAAIDYFQQHIDPQELRSHEAHLCARLIQGIANNDQIRILGPVSALIEHGHLVSFVVKNVHAHDVAAFFDSRGIAVRAGNHCAQPLSQRLSAPSSVRASFSAYNTADDVDRLLAALADLTR